MQHYNHTSYTYFLKPRMSVLVHTPFNLFYVILPGVFYDFVNHVFCCGWMWLMADSVIADHAIRLMGAPR
jgi:hypothetical protein